MNIIPNFLRDPQLKELFGYLDWFKDNRNKFAHSINPMSVELEQTSKDNIPYVKLYFFKNGELLSFSFTESEIIEVNRKLDVLKTMVAVLENFIITDVMKLKSDIYTDIAKSKKQAGIES